MPSNPPDPASGAIPQRSRTRLTVLGGLSWIAGTIATFASDNGSGTVALIVGGAVALFLGMIGRWPRRIGVSGGEVEWEAVERTVTSAIDANEGDADRVVVEELRGLLDRLEQLRHTGSAPPHPAEVYDRAVRSAVARLVPGAELIPVAERSRTVPDFELRLTDRRVLLETKWRPDPERPMRGSSLPALLQAVSADAVLVVISNAVDVDPARELVKRSGRSLIEVVRWRDARDDAALAEALGRAVEAAGRG